jgi:hypothetical protein
MQLKAKLAWLELIAGLFGWLWILASVAFLYFLAVAVFGDSAWSRVFWAFGVGAVAKWLAGGFDDSKKRVAFEADLVARGYTPEAAAKEWTDRYLGGKP